MDPSTARTIASLWRESYFFQGKGHCKPTGVVHACSLSTQEAEDECQEVKSQPEPHSKFQAILYRVAPSLKYTKLTVIEVSITEVYSQYNLKNCHIICYLQMLQYCPENKNIT